MKSVCYYIANVVKFFEQPSTTGKKMCRMLTFHKKTRVLFIKTSGNSEDLKNSFYFCKVVPFIR